MLSTWTHHNTVNLLYSSTKKKKKQKKQGANSGSWWSLFRFNQCVSECGLGSSSMFGITGLEAHGACKWRQGCISSRVLRFQNWVTLSMRAKAKDAESDILSWPKSSIGLFPYNVTKNRSELFGQCNTSTLRDNLSQCGALRRLSWRETDGFYLKEVMASAKPLLLTLDSAHTARLSRW